MQIGNTVLRQFDGPIGYYLKTGAFLSLPFDKQIENIPVQKSSTWDWCRDLFRSYSKPSTLSCRFWFVSASKTKCSMTFIDICLTSDIYLPASLWDCRRNHTFDWQKNWVHRMHWDQELVALVPGTYISIQKKSRVKIELRVLTYFV